MLKSCIYPWDARRDIAVPGNEKQTLQFCVDHFLEACKKAIEEKGSFYVALSGGSTPKALFSLITHPPYSSLIDWSKVHLFWSDERRVSPDDPDSNFHMAMQAGFKDVGIPSQQIHRMKAEGDIEKEAAAYEELLKTVLKGKGFDYLMLGMGEDGHTASLFPGTKALQEKESLVVANPVPQKNTVRMTLTFSCINASKSIVLYVLGKNKKEKVAEIFSLQSLIYPVQSVGTKEHKALWITDDEAASFLPFVK